MAIAPRLAISVLSKTEESQRELYAFLFNGFFRTSEETSEMGAEREDVEGSFVSGDLPVYIGAIQNFYEDLQSRKYADMVVEGKYYKIEVPSDGFRVMGVGHQMN